LPHAALAVAALAGASTAALAGAAACLPAPRASLGERRGGRVFVRAGRDQPQPEGEEGEDRSHFVKTRRHEEVSFLMVIKKFKRLILLIKVWR
jgi:hypothetical protein